MRKPNEQERQNGLRLKRLQLLNELSESQKINNAIAEAKANFLANISHEIYTPMNSIIGFLSLQLEGYKLSKNHEHMLNIARKCSNSLMGLITNIIDMSNMEKGRFKIEKKVFNLPSMLQDTVQFLDIKAKRKALFLDLNIEDDCKKMYFGDPRRINQILTNIISNGIKYTEKGGVTVDVSLIETDQDTQTDLVRFSISDTGIGMSKDFCNKIFEPFTQLDNSSERHQGGIGLCASLAKRLVDLMGGRLQVDSVPGKGSRFQVQLELPVSKEQVLGLAPDGNTMEDHARIFHVLVADDEELNTDLVKHRLEADGHSATTVSNGEKALEAFHKDSYDAIFMDVQMPIMDGYEATKKIRNLEQEQGGNPEQQIPIIALTGSVSEKSVDMCIQAGMDSVISKPIDFDLLFLIMENLIPEKGGRAIIKQQSKNGEQSEFNFPDLAGIDKKQGLLIWQDPAVYTNALIKFSHDYNNVTDEISTLIEKDNITDIEYIAHALQGLSGNLSMTEVYSITKKINSAAKRRSMVDVQALVGPLRKAIEEVVSSGQLLENSFPRYQNPRRAKTKDPKALKKYLFLLLDSCRQADPDETEYYFEKIKDYLEPEYLNVLTDHFNQFNFDSAAEELEKIADHFDILLETE